MDTGAGWLMSTLNDSMYHIKLSLPLACHPNQLKHLMTKVF